MGFARDQLPSTRAAFSCGRQEAVAAFAGLALAMLACTSTEHGSKEPDRPNGHKPSSGTEPKVGSQPPTPRIEIGCAGPCNRGDLLLFRIADLQQPGYLGAAAIPEQGSPIWFFPTEKGRAPRVEASSELRLAPRGVRIGEELAPGTYRLRVWVTPEKTTRQRLQLAVDPDRDASSAAMLASQVLDLAVLP